MAKSGESRLDGWFCSASEVFGRFRSCTSGATSIEYALIAVIFAVATIATWRAVGTSVGRMYNSIGSSVVNN